MAKSTSNEQDWFATVLSVVNPVLIMGVVGSLAFFLLDVGYRGEFIGQMRWTMFFFVFGAVLVARICLLMGNQYGSIYGLALGAATFAVSLKFVAGSGVIVSLGVILVIAFSAYFITRDCTWMERPDRVAPQGLATELSDLWQLLPTAKGEARKRRRGLTIVWFALAAIPLFGLGQSLIPEGEQNRRWSAFQFMTIYIGCSLALLLTTALVSLRSYLQSRKLSMPPAMTGMWLGFGALIIIATLFVGAMFPRPHSELWTISGLQSPNRDANRIAPNPEKGGQGEGDPGAKGQKDNSAKDGNSKQGNPDEKAEQKTKDGKKGPGGDKNSKEGKGENQTDDPNGEPKPQSTPQVLQQLAQGIQEFIKWVAIIGIVLLILFMVVRGWAGISQGFRKWLEKLLAKKKDVQPVAPNTELAAATASRPGRPFSSFDNPFEVGQADRQSDDELVSYTFSALEAWGREHGQARTADETAIEYARLIGDTDETLRDPALKLSGHMMRIAYSASRRTSPKVRGDLRELWRQMSLACDHAEHSPSN